MKKTILIIIVILLFLSCSTRKKVTENLNIKTAYDAVMKFDTVILWKERTVIAPSQNTELIPSPCDSYGNLNIIEKIIKIPQGTVRVSNDNGNLRIEAVTDSIISVKDKEFGKKYQLQNSKITEIEQKYTEEVKSSQSWKNTCMALGGILCISLIINAVYSLRKT